MSFNINEENIESSVQQTMNFFDVNFSYSFNFVICNLIHSAFISQKYDANTYINYMKTLQNKEETNISQIKIIDIFVQSMKLL